MIGVHIHAPKANAITNFLNDHPTAPAATNDGNRIPGTKRETKTHFIPCSSNKRRPFAIRFGLATRSIHFQCFRVFAAK